MNQEDPSGLAPCASGDTVSFATSCTDGAGTSNLLQPSIGSDSEYCQSISVIAGSAAGLGFDTLPETDGYSSIAILGGLAVGFTSNAICG